MSKMRCVVGETIAVSPQLELTVVDIVGDSVMIEIAAPGLVPREEDEPEASLATSGRDESPFYAEFA